MEEKRIWVFGISRSVYNIILTIRGYEKAGIGKIAPSGRRSIFEQAMQRMSSLVDFFRRKQ